MGLDGGRKPGDKDYAEPRIVEVDPEQPDVIPTTPKEDPLRRMDVEKIIKRDQETWWNPKTPQARL